MAKKKLDTIDALIFIDTNILLDFYRIRKANISLKYLEEIEKHKDLIITTEQVEMEYKKNRQGAILESLSEVKKIENTSINVPAVLADAKAVEMIKKSKKTVATQQKKLKLKIERILKDPGRHDQVYKSLQRLFKYKSNINLTRDREERVKVRNLAKKRFLLGYPPRKKADNSIGDSVNWEWVIMCAQNSDKDIIIVTRDTDFGTIYESESYLNDWLNHEFKERVSRKRKLILTDKLSYAFKLVKIPVTKEMVKEEENIIDEAWQDYQRAKILDAATNYRLTTNIEKWRNINPMSQNEKLAEIFKTVERLNKIHNRLNKIQGKEDED